MNDAVRVAQRSEPDDHTYLETCYLLEVLLGTDPEAHLLVVEGVIIYANAAAVRGNHFLFYWLILGHLGSAYAIRSNLGPPVGILLVIGAVFSSGTFGAFASPLSDNTVTLCTILDLPVLEYAQLKLKPSLLAAAITTLMFGAAAIFFH